MDDPDLDAPATLEPGTVVVPVNGRVNLYKHRLVTVPPIENRDQVEILNLQCNYIHELALEGFMRLRFLYLGANNLTRIPTLAALPALEELYLNNNSLVSLDGLESAQPRRLRVLDVRQNRLQDISALLHQPELESLSLSCNIRLADLSPVRQLSRLRFLGLFALAALQNEDALCSVLAALPRLEELSLGPTVSPQTVMRVRRLCPSLQWLDNMYMGQAAARPDTSVARDVAAAAAPEPGSAVTVTTR